MNVSVRAGDSPTATLVTVNGLTLLFSYETVVAFREGWGEWVASENVWSKTTGKHINAETGVGPKDRLPHTEFTAKLSAALGADDA